MGESVMNFQKLKRNQMIDSSNSYTRRWNHDYYKDAFEYIFLWGRNGFTGLL